MSNRLKPEDIDVVIYHHPCSDGTGSGLIAWKYLSTNFSERDVEYYPSLIGTGPPKDLQGKNVLICDYSYKKDVLLDLISKVKNLLIIGKFVENENIFLTLVYLDHHKSAEKELSDIPAEYKIFDMKHSGAMLTWFYFFPDLESPLLIKYIEDRDIWTKQLPYTDDFISWFYTLPFDFKEYDKYIQDDALIMKMIHTKGIPYGELNQYYTENATNYSVPKFSKIKDKYYMIGYVNSTICKSDIGHHIFNRFNLIDFSATYSINDVTDSTSFSLRSVDTGSDVSDIAR